MKKICFHTTLVTILVAAFLPTTAQVLPKIEQPTFKKDTFNIAKYGSLVEGNWEGLTEATPVFKDIYVNNVICNGAEKDIFIRDLPEMHIKNIKLENMVLQANKGIDYSEATGITFNNIKLITKETNPVVDVLNSDNLSFNKITYRDATELQFRIGGDRTGKIAITNTDASKARQKVQYEFGASEKGVTMK
ncbi:MAG: hypothetical protein DI539_19460 [Flavobacterium psychrophilum]|nr:MAG: hypothetical protein DI539_19460 [Flavobacterium psychrophilum]